MKSNHSTFTNRTESDPHFNYLMIQIIIQIFRGRQVTGSRNLRDLDHIFRKRSSRFVSCTTSHRGKIQPLQTLGRTGCPCRIELAYQRKMGQTKLTISASRMRSNSALLGWGMMHLFFSCFFGCTYHGIILVPTAWYTTARYRLIQRERPKYVKMRKFTPFSGDVFGGFAHVFYELLSTRYRTVYFCFFLPDTWSFCFQDVQAVRNPFPGKKHTHTLRQRVDIGSQNTCTKIEDFSLENGVNIWAIARKTHVIYVVAL